MFFLNITRKSKFDSLSLGKTLTLHNFIAHVKSVLKKDQNHYYYNIFLQNISINNLKSIDNFFR